MNEHIDDNLIDMCKDVITHPSDDLNYLKVIFDVLDKDDIDNINSALKIILNDEKLSEGEKGSLLENSWKINRKFKLPTPQEFLTEKWIGLQANDLYDHCKKTFIDYFDPLNNKTKLILYCCTGWGKTTLLSLIKFYKALNIISLRSPKQFLKLAESTRLTDASISMTKATCFDLVIKPMLTILETSPMCEKLRYEKDMLNPEYINSGKILFCNTSKGNSMLRVGEVYYDVACDPSSLIGRNIFSGSATELSWLSEVMSEEKVMKLTNELVTRIYNRFGYNNPNTATIIDSSPNSMECLADQWIAKHKDDKDTLFINQNKWTVQSHLFPLYDKDHSKVFTMFKGDSTKPCKIITEDEKKNYTDDQLVDLPIDLLELTKDTPVKILRDFGAIPSGGVDLKLISNFEIIEDAFNPNLKGFLMFHHAPTSLPSEGLLWNIVKNVVFTYSGIGNKYTFWRNPNAERFVSIDLAEAHDMACISMVHLEQDIHGQKVYIVDFSLCIMATKEEINMDSFRYLISDMCKYGNINIKHASLDGYQSSTTIQYLNRIGIDCDKLSVDYPIEPYLTFISNLTQRRVKMPRSIVAKNNLKSLIKAKTQNGKGIHDKIDHVKAEWCDLENSDWLTSKLGYGGKDCIDSVVGACTLADLYGTLDPQYIYNEEEIECLANKDIKSFEKDILSKFGLKAKVS